MSGRTSAQSAASQGGRRHHNPASAAVSLDSLRTAYDPPYHGVERCKGDEDGYARCQPHNELCRSSECGPAPPGLPTTPHHLPMAPSLPSIDPRLLTLPHAASTATQHHHQPAEAPQPPGRLVSQPTPAVQAAPPPTPPCGCLARCHGDLERLTATALSRSLPVLPVLPSSSSLPSPSAPLPSASPPPPPPPPPLPTPLSAIMRLNQGVITRSFLTLRCPACCHRLLLTASPNAAEERCRLARRLVLVCRLYEQAALDLDRAAPAVADAAPRAQAWGQMHDVLGRELRKMECVGAACERLFWRDVLAGNEVAGRMVEFRVVVEGLKAWWGDWAAAAASWSGPEAAGAGG